MCGQGRGEGVAAGHLSRGRGRGVAHVLSGPLAPGPSPGKGGTVSGSVTMAAAAKSAVTYQVTVSAKNSSGTTAAVTFTWKVSPA